MEKKVITVVTEIVSYDYDDITIDEFLDLGNRNKECGATTVTIRSSMDDSWVNVEFTYQREETDEEFATRQLKEMEEEKQVRHYKLTQYERLKNELGL